MKSRARGARGKGQTCAKTGLRSDKCARSIAHPGSKFFAYRGGFSQVWKTLRAAAQCGILAQNQQGWEVVAERLQSKRAKWGFQNPSRRPNSWLLVLLLRHTEPRFRHPTRAETRPRSLGAEPFWAPLFWVRGALLLNLSLERATRAPPKWRTHRPRTQVPQEVPQGGREERGAADHLIPSCCCPESEGDPFPRVGGPSCQSGLSSWVSMSVGVGLTKPSDS